MGKTAADIVMHFALKLGGPIAAGADFNVKEILSGEKLYRCHCHAPADDSADMTAMADVPHHVKPRTRRPTVDAGETTRPPEQPSTARAG